MFFPEKTDFQLSMLKLQLINKSVIKRESLLKSFGDKYSVYFFKKNYLSKTKQTTTCDVISFYRKIWSCPKSTVFKIKGISTCFVIEFYL